jgi:hypothetical protein
MKRPEKTSEDLTNVNALMVCWISGKSAESRVQEALFAGSLSFINS